MRILLIDTSTTYLYVNFFDETNNKTLFSKSMVTHNNHSENLIPTIEEGLKECILELKDFSLVSLPEKVPIIFFINDSVSLASR